MALTDLVDRQGTVTAEELETRVSVLRGALIAEGVGEGDAVLLVAANERESVAAYHAITGIGATAVLSHGGAGASELRHACAVTSPRLALLSPGTEHAAGALDGVGIFESTSLAGDAAPAVDVSPHARRLILFTSGTTSQPKGVVHSAQSLTAAAQNLQALTGSDRSDRVFLVSPLASITGVLQVLEMGPTVGAAAALESAFDAESSLDFLIESGATFYGGPDLVLDRMLAVATQRGVRVPLRVAALGGTMLRHELIQTVESFGIRVVRVYGSSEAPCSTGTRPDEPGSLRLTDEGTPAPGVQVRIAEDDSKELLVAGPHLFGGYLDDEQTTDAVEDGWFHTGDQAEIVDGRVRIIGRLKDVASRNGKKISLAEVDQAFTTATGIVDCAAFIVPDDATGERVAMAVRLADGGAIDVPSVLAAMESSGLAKFKLPESVVRIDAPLPLTPTGKVQRRDLSEDADVLWRASRLGNAAE